MALNGRYLQEAERLLEQGDYPQASEKFWGAVATAIKTIALAREWRHFSHAELRAVIQRLSGADQDLPRLFQVAESLHANFYEDFMQPETVTAYAQDTKRLIEKLAQLR